MKSPARIARDSFVEINCYGLWELRLNNWKHGELDLSFGKRKMSVWNSTSAYWDV